MESELATVMCNSQQPTTAAPYCHIIWKYFLTNIFCNTILTSSDNNGGKLFLMTGAEMSSNVRFSTNNSDSHYKMRKLNKRFDSHFKT